MSHVVHKKTYAQHILEWFRWSIVLKGAYAAGETLLGLLAFILQPEQINALATTLTIGELTEDPHDVIANAFLHAAQQVTLGAELFAAIYLTTHGLLKLALVAGLLKNKLWAYPASLIIFSAFALYQVYLFIFTFSVGLAILTILDAIVIWFIWKEYQIQRKTHLHMRKHA